MRRFICLAVIALFFITIITGFAEAHVHPGDSGIHTVMAILLIIAAFAHTVINRKALARHLALSVKKAEQ